MENRLTRSESEKMIAGVCGGLAAYLGIDPTIVRIGFVVLLFASGIGLPLYIVLAVIMPSDEQAAAPSGKMVERNIEDLGESISKSVEQFETSRSGPMLIAGLLIAGGIYFLLGNLGVSIHLGFLAPVLLIGLGIWLVVRSRNG